MKQSRTRRTGTLAQSLRAVDGLSEVAITAPLPTNVAAATSFAPVRSTDRTAMAAPPRAVLFTERKREGRSFRWPSRLLLLHL